MTEKREGGGGGGGLPNFTRMSVHRSIAQFEGPPRSTAPFPGDGRPSAAVGGLPTALHQTATWSQAARLSRQPERAGYPPRQRVGLGVSCATHGLDIQGGGGGFSPGDNFAGDNFARGKFRHP